MMKRFLYLLLIFVVATLGACNYSEADLKKENEPSEKTYYEIIDKTDEGGEYGYEFFIYDGKGNIVLHNETRVEPRIEYTESGLLEIMVSVGSSAQLFRYYDIEKNILSEESFWNPAAVKGDMIAYMTLDDENNILLAVQNIFDRNVFYKEFEFDFSPTAVPSNVLEKAEFIDDNTLSITYMKGEDYLSENAIIQLNDE